VTWSFERQTYGKWILAGEHAVLRGSEALVFPLRSRKLNLRYEQSSEHLHADFSGATGSEYRLLFWGVVENALARLDLSRSQLSGRFRLDSDLPIGAGLGASAALCVAVARWCHERGSLAADKIYAFARDLENLFHGESSGVDIAVAVRNEALVFRRGAELSTLTSSWKPLLFLSYSGRRGMTSDCVARVQELQKQNAQLAERLDAQMAEAVRIAKQAFVEENSKILAEALGLAEGCFSNWGLINSDMLNHRQWLQSQGALATKPTGSGGGGYYLSLWPSLPPAAIAAQLFPCF
jgi:mevalonate kinase